MKQCSKCKKHRLIEDFWKNKTTKDGLEYACKFCKNNYTAKNADRIKKYQAKYRECNREKLNGHNRNYGKANRKLLSKKEKERKQNDVCFKLTKRLRTRLWCAIKNNQKKGSAIGDLGCSVEELKQYLEDRFLPGMSWENYGEWHIDHIKPLSRFNLMDRSQVKLACHYTNLQPLWAVDNLAKGSKE